MNPPALERARGSGETLRTLHAGCHGPGCASPALTSLAGRRWEKPDPTASAVEARTPPLLHSLPPCGLSPHAKKKARAEAWAAE